MGDAPKMSKRDLATLMDDPEVMDRIFKAAAEAAVEEQLAIIREAEQDERSWREG